MFPPDDWGSGYGRKKKEEEKEEKKKKKKKKTRFVILLHNGRHVKRQTLERIHRNQNSSHSCVNLVFLEPFSQVMSNQTLKKINEKKVPSPPGSFPPSPPFVPSPFFFFFFFQVTSFMSSIMTKSSSKCFKLDIIMGQ